MSMWVVWEPKSISKVVGNLEALEIKIPLKAAAALYQEALIEQKESMKRTPVDVTTKGGGGTLRDSHETSMPYYEGKQLTVDIKVGGPAADYAVVQHEDLTFMHKVGQAKFLESTILESAPHMLSRLAKRMKLNEGDL